MASSDSEPPFQGEGRARRAQRGQHRQASVTPDARQARRSPLEPASVGPESPQGTGSANAGSRRHPRCGLQNFRFYENAGVKAVLAIPNVKGQKRRTGFQRYFVRGKNAYPHQPASTHPRPRTHAHALTPTPMHAPTHTCTCTHAHALTAPGARAPRSDAHGFSTVTCTAAAPSRASHREMAQAADKPSGWLPEQDGPQVCLRGEERTGRQGEAGGPRITVQSPNAWHGDSSHVGLPFHGCRGVQTTRSGSWREPNSWQREAACPHPGSPPLGQR